MAQNTGPNTPRDLTFPESVAHFKKSHIGVALALLFMGGGLGWTLHDLLKPATAHDFTPAPRETAQASAPSPDQLPTSEPLNHTSMLVPITARARAAIEFQRRFDAMSDKNREETAQKSLGMTVDWDMKVSIPGNYDDDGTYHVTLWPLDTANIRHFLDFRIIPSDERSTLYAQSLKRGDVVHVNGQIYYFAHDALVGIKGTLTRPD